LKLLVHELNEQNERLKDDNRKMRTQLEIIEAQRNTMKSTGVQTIPMEVQELKKPKGKLRPTSTLKEPKSPAGLKPRKSIFGSSTIMPQEFQKGGKKSKKGSANSLFKLQSVDQINFEKGVDKSSTVLKLKVNQ